MKAATDSRQETTESKGGERRWCWQTVLLTGGALFCASLIMLLMGAISPERGPHGRDSPSALYLHGLPEPATLPPAEPQLVELTEPNGSVTALISNLTAAQRATLMAINRVDGPNLRRLVRRRLPLIVPEGEISEDIMQYSPFPRELEVAVAVDKLLLLSYSGQSFGAYEKGKLVRWGPTSKGAASTPTPVGLHSANWRARRTISTENEDWVLNWYVNIHSRRGIAIHQYQLPGYPDSYGCIRLNRDDARWVHNWVETWLLTPEEHVVLAYGTPVIVFGAFGYSARHRDRLEKYSRNYRGEELEAEVREHLESILRRQQDRHELLDLLDRTSLPDDFTIPPGTVPP